MDWLLQASPSDYDVDGALKSGVVTGTCLAPVHRKHLRIGDTAGIWRCGQNAALVATAEILSLPEQLETELQERKFERRPAKFSGKQWRVRIKIKQLRIPIARHTFLGDPVIRSWKVLHGCRGTVFRVPVDVGLAITRLIEANEVSPLAGGRT